jgi:phosphoribosylformylglycinamidine synthase subunit PurL
VREGREDPAIAAARAQDLANPPEPEVYGAALLELLREPSIASKRVIWRRYDHTIGTNTVVGPGMDAALLRLKGTRKAVALTTDCNARLCYLDPYAGAAAAVVEAATNVAVTGARPLCVTDCLNFGNPERPEVYYQLQQAVQGMADACCALGVPVVSGNVSLYNESSTGAVYPTPVVGMAGLLDDVDRRVGAAFAAEGDHVLLLGAQEVSLGGSAYLALRHGLDAGRPVSPDLDLAARLVQLLPDLAASGLLRSAHDCAEGGLAVALVECCLWGGRGARIEVLLGNRPPSHALFGEGPARIVVSCAPSNRPALEAAAAQAGVPVVPLGIVGGHRLVLTAGPATAEVPVPALHEAYEGGLPAACQESMDR